MKERPDIEEKPDHGHYAACAGLKTDIERHCRDTFGYALIASIIMIIFTFAGTVFPVMSFIPSLVGDNYEVGFIFTQVTEFLVIILLAAFGYGERKRLNIVLLCIYLLVFIFSLFTGRALGSALGAMYGACGAFITRRAFSDASYYDRLKATEGYPHFSHAYAAALEKPAYSSEYTREIYEKSRGYYEESSHKTAAASGSSMPGFGGMEDLTSPAPAAAPEPTGFMDDLPSVLPTGIDDSDEGFVPDTSYDEVFDDSSFD